MKRPTLIHLMAIQNDESINIHALMGYERPKKTSAPRPIQYWNLLFKTTFFLTIRIIRQQGETIYEGRYESDSFGQFRISIPLAILKQQDSASQQLALQIYETSTCKNLELLMGIFIPIKITHPKKIIISDFDKTLVETRHESLGDIYRSITRPVSSFPPIQKSMDILKSYIAKGFTPFILTASPHFYEQAIRDCLIKNGIFSSGIFLKDYREFFSIIEGLLSFKDFKAQGFYKLDQLLRIILMTGIPDELVLMGDSFEADLEIYLCFAHLLSSGNDAIDLWQDIKNSDSFRFTPKQSTKFLNKIYDIDGKLREHLATRSETKTKIYIRKFADRPINKTNLSRIKKKFDSVEFYNS